ncbi:MAG: hypothetical protein AAF357_00315 [Verrucomicrobiota bacterium]
MHPETTLDETAPVAPAKPQYITLPTNGTRDPYYGMTRTWWYHHTVPCAYNGHKPPIKSIVIKKDRQAVKGRRYIVTASADEFFERLEQER